MIESLRERQQSRGEEIAAVVGLVLKSVGRLRHPIASAALCIGMGWLVVLAIEPLWLGVPAWGLFWLLAGGVAYTVGVAFFV